MNPTLSLFSDIVVDAPETEGIKYAGSKLKLLPQILELAKKLVQKLCWMASLEQREYRRHLQKADTKSYQAIFLFGQRCSPHVTF